MCAYFTEKGHDMNSILKEMENNENKNNEQVWKENQHNIGLH